MLRTLTGSTPLPAANGESAGAPALRGRAGPGRPVGAVRMDAPAPAAADAAPAAAVPPGAPERAAPEPVAAATASPGQAPGPPENGPPADHLREIARRPRRGDTRARVALRWVRHMLGGSAEQERALAQAAEALRQPVSTGRRIGVRAVSGGAGATTVAALLATAYALRRDDAVLAVDTVPDLGWLAWRLGVSPNDPRDLDAAVGPIVQAPVTAFEQLYVLPGTPGGLTVLPGPAPASRVDPAEATALLARHFAVTVLDEPPLTTAAPRLDTHASVLVARASPSGVRQAIAAVQRHPREEPAPAVVLVSQDPGTEGVRVGASLAALRRAGAQPVHLAYDRHLASGGAIEPGKLSARTVRLASELGGALLATAVGVGPAEPAQAFWSGRSRR